MLKMKMKIIKFILNKQHKLKLFENEHKIINIKNLKVFHNVLFIYYDELVNS